jgi:hypothetical protein
VLDVLHHVDQHLGRAQIRTRRFVDHLLHDRPTIRSRSKNPPKPLQEHFTPPSTTPSKVEKPHQQPPERLWETFIRGYLRHRAPTQNSPPSKTLTN